jgi:hypothetical protein
LRTAETGSPCRLKIDDLVIEDISVVGNYRSRSIASSPALLRRARSDDEGKTVLKLHKRGNNNNVQASNRRQFLHRFVQF